MSLFDRIFLFITCLDWIQGCWALGCCQTPSFQLSWLPHWPREVLGLQAGIKRKNIVTSKCTALNNYIQQHLLQPFDVFVNELVLEEVWLLAVLDVVVNVLLDVFDLLDLHLVIVHHPQQRLQLLDVVPMLLNPGLKTKINAFRF